MLFKNWLENLENKYSPQKLKKLKALISFMPPKKISHSLRVGSAVAKYGLKEKYVDAAILHDYIERGGNIQLLNKLNLSQKTINLVQLLSVEEKTPGADDTQNVYNHIMKALANPAISEKTKNILIIIKCSDRLDNLRNRILMRKLTKSYYDNSLILIQDMLKHYTWKNDILQSIKNKINNTIQMVEEIGLNQSSTLGI